MWHIDETEAFLDERIAAHQHPAPEPCTDEERWKSADVSAVMKGGREKAVRLFDKKEDALNWIDQQKDRQGLFVNVRAGSFRRCESYCDVSHVCPVWKQVVDGSPF